MKRFILLIAAMGLLYGGAWAQPVNFEWQVNFQGNFVNDEFDISGQQLATSRTLGAARLAPYVGLGFGENHRLMGGVDVVKDFGTGHDAPLTELALWYQYSQNYFTFAAGIFPATLLNGRYTSLIFSDYARFYDGHYDGFYWGWKRPRSRYEIIFDWNGKYGATRREQFTVLSAGEGWITPWLALCWEGSFHHFAASANVSGVADDHLLHPYVRFEFSPMLPLDRAELSLGGVIGYQKDRLKTNYYIPKGADVIVDIRKWGFGVKDHFYYGENQAPLYHQKDAAGMEFGEDLYFRSSWWQVRPDGGYGIYNRLEAYWMKSLWKNVSVGVHAVFHFDYLGLMGTQQMVQVRVGLDRRAASSW